MKKYVFEISAYKSDAAHLSMIEHGILRTLLDWYYEKEQPLPNSLDIIMRRLHLSSNEEHHLHAVLSEFFILNENGYTNKYADRILKIHRIKCQQNRLNGKQGGRPMKSDMVISDNPEETISQSTNVKRLLACPSMRIVDLYHEILPELHQCLMLNAQRRKFLQSRWRELVASKEFETEDDGLKFFRKYFEMVKRSKFLMGNNENQWKADFEWLIRPTNFTKTIEGRYQ